jgi:phosphoribosylanthranilate isomerase
VWIKICGVTRAEDAATVIHSGADAIGFNFFPDSRRFVSIPIACALAESARRSAVDLPLVDLVGVFVNAEAEAIRTAVQKVGLSVIQVHGDESIENVTEIHRLCPNVPIVRAFRVDPGNVEHTLIDIDRLSAQVPLAAILLDAFVPGEFGGTGTTVDLSSLESYTLQQRPPLILAGGLTPKNVAFIVNDRQVWGIDTASGVESSPGIKDSARVYEFVNAARAAASDSGRLIHNVRIGKPLLFEQK